MRELDDAIRERSASLACSARRPASRHLRPASASTAVSGPPDTCQRGVTGILSKSPKTRSGSLKYFSASSRGIFVRSPTCTVLVFARLPLPLPDETVTEVERP